MKFWQPKPPEVFLIETESYLEHLDDHKKLRYLEKNLIALCKAMENDPMPVPHALDADYNFCDELKVTMEWTAGYLHWHDRILESLHDAKGLNSDHLSPAAKLFFQKTEADAIAAFHTIFKLNPHLAIGKLTPAKLFKHTILQAMESLVNHDNPHLYFDCLDVIDFGDDAADLVGMTARLSCSTTEALSNLLAKDPDALLFPGAGKSRRPGMQKNYLDYLPSGLPRERFIVDNMSDIETAVRAIAEGATNHHLDGFDAIYSSFNDISRPAQLMGLKKLLLAERVKLCFQIAAGTDRTKLVEYVETLDAEATGLVKLFSHYPDEATSRDPFTPVYELMRLTNPNAAENAPDENLGADSKYLWLIRTQSRTENIILAAAFLKADIEGYLNVQAERDPSKLPSVQRWNDFLYEARHQ